MIAYIAFRMQTKFGDSLLGGKEAEVANISGVTEECVPLGFGE